MRDSSHKLGWYRRSLKRLLDIAGATFGIVLTFPLALALAATIFVRDGLPVLHREPRLGRDGRRFTLLKFRTLRTSAESRPSVAPDDDPRLTSTGLFLRRWRLDELPQLLNVLLGDMSLVGPRPLHVLHADALHPEMRRELLSVRPGMTDPAAIRFLAEDSVLAGLGNPESVYLQRILPAKVGMQLEYIRHESVLSDIAVLGQTLFLVWSPAHRQKSRRFLLCLVDGAPPE